MSAKRGYHAKVWAGERLRSGQHCWYFRVYNDAGELVAMDNTGDWRKMYSKADQLARILQELDYIRGIEVKQPDWIKEYV